MIASKERIFRVIKTFREATVFLDHSNVVVEKPGRPFKTFALVSAISLNRKIKMPCIVSFSESKTLYGLAVYKTLGKKKSFSRALKEDIAVALVTRALSMSSFALAEEFSSFGKKAVLALSQDFVAKTTVSQGRFLAKEYTVVITSKPLRRNLRQYAYRTRIYRTAWCVSLPRSSSFVSFELVGPLRFSTSKALFVVQENAKEIPTLVAKSHFLVKEEVKGSMVGLKRGVFLIEERVSFRAAPYKAMALCEEVAT